MYCTTMKMYNIKRESTKTVSSDVTNINFVYYRIFLLTNFLPVRTVNSI